ncbi:MAG: hypothetical protein ACOC3C_06840 [Candidatus Thorarchaeota archaeon]
MVKQSMTGDFIIGLLMDEIDSVNIDTELDLLIAEAIINSRTENSQ